jgi:hypothetical protein
MAYPKGNADLAFFIHVQQAVLRVGIVDVQVDPDTGASFILDSCTRLLISNAAGTSAATVRVAPHETCVCIVFQNSGSSVHGNVVGPDARAGRGREGDATYLAAARSTTDAHFDCLDALDFNPTMYVIVGTTNPKQRLLFKLITYGFESCRQILRDVEEAAREAPQTFPTFLMKQFQPSTKKAGTQPAIREFQARCRSAMSALESTLSLLRHLPPLVRCRYSDTSWHLIFQRLPPFLLSLRRTVDAM